jgi:hypothetical protein
MYQRKLPGVSRNSNYFEENRRSSSSIDVQDGFADDAGFRNQYRRQNRRRKGGCCGSFFLFLFVIVIVGGAGYYWLENYKIPILKQAILKQETEFWEGRYELLEKKHEKTKLAVQELENGNSQLEQSKKELREALEATEVQLRISKETMEQTHDINKVELELKMAGLIETKMQLQQAIQSFSRRALVEKYVSLFERVFVPCAFARLLLIDSQWYPFSHFVAAAPGLVGVHIKSR